MDNTNLQSLSRQQADLVRRPLSSSTPSKKFMILLAILLLALFGIVGYTLVVKQNQTTVQNNQATSPTISQPSLASTASAIQTSLTANWKIYRNTKVGFEMKFPSRYHSPYAPDKVKGLGSSKAVDGTEDYTTISFDEPSTHESRGERIMLNIFPYSKSLDDLVKDSYSGGSYNAGSHFDYDSPTKKVKDFFVDGREARWHVTTKDEFGINNYINSDEESDMEIFFMGNNHAFMVQTRLDHDREELNYILSTFKFTQ